MNLLHSPASIAQNRLSIRSPDGASHMYALIDYNNLPAYIRRKGFRYIAELIVDAAGDHLSEVRAITIRLYDGWYRGTQPTRHADRIRLSIDQQPSFVTTQSCTPISRRFLVRIEQAVAVLDEPTRCLIHTFRPDRSPGGIRLRNAADLGCRSTSCPVEMVAGFMNRNVCPMPECSIQCESLLSRDEQKLIDTMICVDLIHLAATENKTAVVLSSDDDLIPAIRYACRRDLFVLHIGTHPGRRLRPEYVDGLTGNYSYTTLRDV